jgi:aminocarboxymuconate-semialdehyde decarboxylase
LTDPGGAIDVHAHVVLAAAFGAAGRYGPELTDDDAGRSYFRVGEYVMGPMPYRGSVFMDLEARLAALDRHGIAQQLVSPNPLTFFHGIPAAEARDYCRRHNDAMAELVARRPDRLVGGIALPMQDVDAACVELARAVTELRLAAPYVGTDFGFPLDDPRLDDFYRTLVELDVALFVHPASTDGTGAPADRRQRRFQLDLLAGYLYEETLAVAALVLGGVTVRHPDVDICVSHGGGALALLAERMEVATRLWPGAPDEVRGDGLRAHLRHLWYDCHMGSQGALDLLVATVGTERLVYGTNYGGWDCGGHHARDPFVLALTPNARRLLRLDRSIT